MCPSREAQRVATGLDRGTRQGDLRNSGPMQVPAAHGTSAAGLGAVTLVGVSVAVVTLIVLHAVPTGLSPVRDAVSRYGITQYRLGYRVLTVSMGVAGLAAALGISQVLTGRWGVVVGCLVAFGGARLVISWFPMDAPNAPRTQTGTTHGLLAVVTFAAATLAAFRLGGLVSGTGQWTGQGTALTWCGWYLLGGLVAVIAARRVPSARWSFGLVERGFYLGVLGWLALVGVALLG